METTNELLLMFSLSGSPGGEKQRMYVSHEGSVKILQSCREKKDFIITEMSAKVIIKTHTHKKLYRGIKFTITKIN